MDSLVIDHYGSLFEKPLLEEIAAVGVYKEFSEGSLLINIGDYIKSMPLLLEGAIKIMRDDDDGDELLLYFLEPGDTCAMTLTCCFGNTKSEIKAITELDTKLIMVPVTKMDTWMVHYRSWRNFVLDSYQLRLNELLKTIDNIAFKNMDQRLLNYLKEKSRITQSNILHQTHQEIAYDLHTSRVVISRLLKQLEKIQLVKLHRNAIEMTNNTPK